jgi:hypothetical protein
MVRIQKQQILDDLEKKMVFIVGPRQAGKTWLARDIGTSFESVVYLNYDNRADRDTINSERWLPTTQLLIFDEIHKMADWQTFIKGVFDTRPANMRILVTGSARMDLLAHAGESLAGRYFRHRLLPLSPAELRAAGMKDTFERLLVRGGFPEPYLTGDDRDALRWRNQYLDGIIRYDSLDFQRIVDFKALQLTAELLRERVGSPVSFSSIARDIGASPATVSKYIMLLESLFLIFRVTPFTHNIARTLLKEPKIYFFDSGMVKGDRGALLENCVAVSLLKSIWARNDQLGETGMLHYLRTKEGREVDFAIAGGDRQLSQLIECKSSDLHPDKNLIYFSEKYAIPALQLSANLRVDQRFGAIKVRNTEAYLAGLFI